MGAMVTAAKAAQLAGVSERTVRAWLQSGRLHAQKATRRGPISWAIDVDALAAVEGVMLRRDLLDEREHTNDHEREWRSGVADAVPAAILARLSGLEAQMRAMRERFAELERIASRPRPTPAQIPVPPLPSLSEPAPAPAKAVYGALPPLSVQEPTTPVPLADVASLATGLAFARPSAPTQPMIRGNGLLRTHADAARWLVRHGLASVGTPKSWVGWYEVALEPRAVLSFALSLPPDHRRTWRLYPCGEPVCVCAEMLG
jgi:hypothetical protein